MGMYIIGGSQIRVAAGRCRDVYLWIHAREKRAGARADSLTQSARTQRIIPCRAVPVTSDTVKRGHYFECTAGYFRSAGRPAGALSAKRTLKPRSAAEFRYLLVRRCE